MRWKHRILASASFLIAILASFSHVPAFGQEITVESEASKPFCDYRVTAPTANSHNTRREFLQAAIDYFSKQLAISPHDPGLLYCRGISFAALGAFDQAREDINKAIEYDPINVSFFRASADLYRLMGEYDESLDDLEKALSIDPNDELIWHDIGLVNLLKSEYHVAAEAFSWEVHYGSGEPHADAWRAYAYDLMDETSKRDADLQQTRSFTTVTALFLLNGRSAYNFEDFQVAKLQYSVALLLDNGLVESYLMLGLVYAELNDFDTSLEYFESYLERVDPSEILQATLDLIETVRQKAGHRI